MKSKKIFFILLISLFTTSLHAADHEAKVCILKIKSEQDPGLDKKPSCLGRTIAIKTFMDGFVVMSAIMQIYQIDQLKKNFGTNGTYDAICLSDDQNLMNFATTPYLANIGALGSSTLAIFFDNKALNA